MAKVDHEDELGAQATADLHLKDSAVQVQVARLHILHPAVKEALGGIDRRDRWEGVGGRDIG